MSRSRGAAALPIRIALSGLLAVLFVLLSVGTAYADPAAPTNYQSTVFDVEPANDAAEFTVVGGDAYIEIVVTPGHSALVPGYFKEPYIRIDPDRSVWVNLDSPAYYINQDRYGNVQAPSDADGQGDPRWENVGSGGRYAWQDHRIHWMSFDLPPTVAGDRYQVVFPWEFPVVVDGQEASVRGELVWVPSRNPTWPVLAGILGLLPIVFWDRLRVRTAAAIVTLAALVALWIALLQFSGTPASARELSLPLLLPVLAIAAAGGALFVRGRSRPVAGGLLVLGGLLLAVWALLNAGTMWLPVLPSATAANLQRAGVAIVLWSGLAATVTMGWSLIRSR